MSATYTRKGTLIQRLEDVFSLQFAGKKSNLPDRLARLGVPPEEMTESVALALSALLEKTDDLQLVLDQTKAQLTELQSLVDVDTVAPIPNRRAFMRRLQWVISMQDRYGHPSSVLFFDLNRFKQINDEFGHLAGDLAIRHVADQLTRHKRESDFLARIGGDEFAIILYHATRDDAERRGEQFAGQLRRAPFIFNGRSIPLDTAVGIHEIRKGETPEDALREADLSMYAHKKLQKENATVLEA